MHKFENIISVLAEHANSKIVHHCIQFVFTLKKQGWARYPHAIADTKMLSWISLENFQHKCHNLVWWLG